MWPLKWPRDFDLGLGLFGDLTGGHSETISAAMRATEAKFKTRQRGRQRKTAPNVAA